MPGHVYQRVIITLEPTDIDQSEDLALTSASSQTNHIQYFLLFLPLKGRSALTLLAVGSLQIKYLPVRRQKGFFHPFQPLPLAVSVTAV